MNAAIAATKTPAADEKPVRTILFLNERKMLPFSITKEKFSKCHVVGIEKSNIAAPAESLNAPNTIIRSGLKKRNVTKSISNSQTTDMILFFIMHPPLFRAYTY